jgi:hypothetical protein
MLAPPTLSTPTAQTAAPPAPEAAASPRALIERQLQMLGQLAEAGLNLALAIERRATAQDPALQAAPLEAAALAYARTARAVRLTLALQAKVINDLQALDRAAGSELYNARCNAEREARHHAAQRQARVQRLVARVIEAEVADPAKADRLAEEAAERLEHDDIYGDLKTKTVGEIVALICRDLGLSPDWSRWAQEAWAQAEIRSGAPGSPFAGFPVAPGEWSDPPDPAAPADPGPAAPHLAEPMAASP